ncbi:S8 family serine peptidase [Tundrisphaera sp. TA3]|uniref:S8 family serine peptidase n=1 Tax=Tundrisphaera sp. TA3 TaxID=3435775 RepID=UPI003EBB83EB
MRRPSHRLGRANRVEPLESRTLMDGGGARAAGPWPDPDASRTVLVRFAETATESSVRAALKPLRAEVMRAYPGGLRSIAIGPGIDRDRAIRVLEARPSVVYAEADAVVRPAAVRVTPDDPAFPRLWGLDQANNIDIDAPEAWSISTGSASTIVAVIDTGIDLNNPDFAGRLWTNPTPGAGGYANDLHGWNFVNGTPDIQDDDGHGTHVASVIAAAGNNGYGVTGIDWNARIMPLKFLDARGNGTIDTAVSAVYYAVNHGARVINASWGGGSYSRALHDAIAFANARGVVFVTAAGNQGSSNDIRVNYPATDPLANVISVAAVDRSGRLASFSNYGRNVDIAAPGSEILGLVPPRVDRSGLAVYSGTSMATAYVSGVASLVIGLYPELNAAQVATRIVAGAKPLPGLGGLVAARGIVDAALALASGAGSAPPSQSTVSRAGTAAGLVSDASVRAAILGSDEFKAANGGTNAGFVAGLYLDVLGRAVDPSGLAGWAGSLDAGLATRDQVARAILTSPEGRITQVARWYQEDLGRAQPLDALKADPGVQVWAGWLVNGLADDAVRATILSLPEALARDGARPQGLVGTWYARFTGREASAAELAPWAARLAAGASPLSLIQAFQGSPEARAAKVARWYRADLGRTAPLATLKTDPGVLAWASILVLA